MKPVSIRRPILVFGLLGGALTLLLKTIEYRYLVVEHSAEIYGGLIAVVFVSVGLWLGVTFTRRDERVAVQTLSPPRPEPFQPDAARVAQVGLTPREYQILELIAQGLSNREIAERIFVSENTVKTHLSRLFEKLNARRRTQAVQIGKEMGILR